MTHRVPTPTEPGVPERKSGVYERLVQSISDYAIYLLDLEGRVTTWNYGAQRAKGYSEQEIVGHHFSCFYSPEDQRAGLTARASGRTS